MGGDKAPGPPDFGCALGRVWVQSLDCGQALRSTAGETHSLTLAGAWLDQPHLMASPRLMLFGPRNGTSTR